MWQSFCKKCMNVCTWCQDRYENNIKKYLVREPLKHGSYFLSHGFFHSIMCLTVGLLTGLGAYRSCSSSETTMHNIYLEIEPPQTASTLKDTMTNLFVSFELDSDSLLKKTNKKYNSRINITYGYDYSCRDSEYIDTPKEPTILRLYSEPLLEDLFIQQDSSFTIYEIKESKELENNQEIKSSTYKSLPDSIVEISVKPFKNIKNETGGEDGVGSQTVYIYSNKLGLAEDESYYNYYIDFGRIPTIKETNSFDGLGIQIQIGDFATNKGIFHIGNKRLLYQYIHPQPDIINNGFLFYYTKESIEKVINNNGIIIQSTDIDALNKNNRRDIFFSVLVGTGVALFIDILIQLIRELRNVNRRKEEEERKEKVLKEKYNEET